MTCLLGIEAGTTKVKAVLVDVEKGLMAHASADCSMDFTSDGRAEIEMERYWRACRKCLSIISKKAPGGFKKIAALSVASQGVTFVPVDCRGRELGKGIVLYDTRAGIEAKDIIRRFGEETLYKVTGQPKISAIYEGAKLLWLRRHEPARFRKIHKILLVHDYLVYKLTGKFSAVPSLLSSSLLFDLKNRSWWDSMIEYLGLSPDQFPEIYGHGRPVETVCQKASSETGLQRETIVVTGALDQICGMTGIGNIAPGNISESTGTVLAVHTLARDFFPLKESGILNFCHIRDDLFALIGVAPTACSALDWFVSNLAGNDSLELLSRKAAGITAGSDGLIMLPHLAGSGSPRPDPSAKGLFYGLQLHHKTEHFIRALLEAIAFTLRSNIETLRQNGRQVDEIRSFGGGSRNRFWNQIKADVCGLPVVTSDCPEPGCLGAAILAGVGISLFKDQEEGCRRLVSFNRPCRPDKAAVKKYEIFYRRYLELEQCMLPLSEGRSRHVNSVC